MPEDRSPLYDAKVRLTEAQADKFELEAQRLRYEVGTQSAILRATELELLQKESNYKSWRARNDSRTVYFLGEVNSSSVARAMDSLTEFSLTDPGCDIDFIINSPGGEITEGLALFDHIQILKRRGHLVTTMALGEAASMGGVLLQAGTIRAMSKESWLMLHEAAFGGRGKTFEMEDRVEFVKRVQGRLLDIFAARSTMDRDAIKSKWERRDWWLSSDDALAAGFIDEVR